MSRVSASEAATNNSVENGATLLLCPYFLPPPLCLSRFYHGPVRSPFILSSFFAVLLSVLLLLLLLLLVVVVRL